MALDASDNVYVTGYSVGATSNDDYCTIKYNPQGVQQWVARYNGPGDWDDWATALAVDVSGNVYVTGYSDDSTSYYDFCTIKYSQETGVEEQRQELSSLILEVLGSEIRFDLPQAANIRLDLYDVAGSKVQKIASGLYPAGEHSAAINYTGLASGVYFVKLSTGNQTLTCKTVIITP